MSPVHNAHIRRRFGFALAFLFAASHIHAQNKGTPGQFDFYLLNVAAPADFCHVPGAGPACTPPRTFVLHGLWTQNDNGTYPVNCADEPGPGHLERFLDLTPDLPLLQHEWDKHGSCTGLGPERFFAMERRAYSRLQLPLRLQQPQHEVTLATEDVLRELYRINPRFPSGSILLSCKAGKLTAVEACFSKELQPVRCEGLRGCEEKSITLEATVPARSPRP